MPFQPLTMDELGEPYIRGTIYGGTGVGKTIFACTSQQLRTFHFDCEDGAISVRAYCAKNGLRRDLYRAAKVTNRQSFLEAFAWLVQHKDQFDLTVIDTGTELQRIMLQELCDVSKVSVPDQRLWGIVLTLMESITTNFRWMPMHVLFLCHEGIGQDTNTGATIWKPHYKGQFSTEYGKHFSLIARYQVVEQQVKDQTTGQLGSVVHRFLNCQRDQFTDAKDRSMALAKYEFPNVDAVLSKMMSAINAIQQPAVAQLSTR